LEQHDASGTVTAVSPVWAAAHSITSPRGAGWWLAAGRLLSALSELNPAVSQALDFIIQKAMALAPQDRYPSVSAKRGSRAFGSVRHLPPRGSAPPSLRIVLVYLTSSRSCCFAALTAGLLVPPGRSL
jgi:hypothetical protein